MMAAAVATDSKHSSDSDSDDDDMLQDIGNWINRRNYLFKWDRAVANPNDKCLLSESFIQLH